MSVVKKTIDDALVAFQDGWPLMLPLLDGEHWWLQSNGDLVWSYECEGLRRHQFVCTKAQFEARRGVKQ